MDRVIPVLVLIAVLGVVVAIIVQLFRNAKREEEAQSWPTTEATVQSSAMETVASGRSAVILPCFAFSYVVNGEYYSGRFSLSEASDRSATLLREMIDKKLTVHYNPTKPQDFLLPEVMSGGCEVRRIAD